MLKFQDVPALKPNLAVILDLYVVQFQFAFSDRINFSSCSSPNMVFLLLRSDQKTTYPTNFM